MKFVFPPIFFIRVILFVSLLSFPFFSSGQVKYSASSGYGGTWDFTDPCGNLIRVHCATPMLPGCGATEQFYLVNGTFVSTRGSGIVQDYIPDNPLPNCTVCNLSLSVSPSSASIIAGNSATLSASPSNGSGNYSYSWSNGATGSSISVSPTSTTTYNLTVTDNSVSNCSRSASSTVTVTQPCNAPTSAGGINISSTSVLLGYSVNINNSAIASGGSGSIEYQFEYSFNGGGYTVFQSWNSSNTASFTPSTAGNYSIRRRARANCGSSSVDASGSLSVYTCPTITVSASASPSTICPSQSVTLNANASGSYSYTWNNGAGTGSTVYVAPSSTTTYTVTATSGNCSGTGSVTVNVSSPAVSISASNPTLCINGSTTLSPTLTPNGATGTPTYQWQKQVGATWTAISGATSSTYTPPTNAVGATNYRLGIYYASRAACGTIYSTSTTITVNALPTLTNTTTTNTICVGGVGTISPTVAGGAGSATYKWESSANGTSWTAISGATASTYSPVTTAASTMHYRAIVTFPGNGCGIATSNSSTLVVVPKPTVSITSTTTTVCKGSTATITSSATNGTGTFSYKWSTVSGATTTTIAGQTTDSYTTPALTATTVYQVVVTQPASGCTATSNNLTITVPAVATRTGTATASTNCTTPNGKIAVTGAVATEQYSIDGGTTWVNSSPAPQFTNLDAGSYTIKTRQTANSCEGAASAAVVITKPTVSARQGTATASTSCISENGKITVTGAVATEQYSIDNGATWVANTPAPQFNNLAANNYTIITKIIATNCTSAASSTITIVNPTVTARQGIITASTSCLTENGKITVTGAVSTEQYSIDEGVTWVSNTPTPQFNNLAVGPYNILTKVISSGCKSVASSTLFVNNPNVTARTGTATALTNCDYPDGKITVTGAVATEQYSIDNGTTWVANTPAPQFTYLSAGTYNIRTKNIASGCISAASSNIVVTNPTVTVRSGTATASTNCFSPNGKITVTGALATEYYTIDNGETWYTNAPAPQFTDLAPGTYNIKTKNLASGCISNASATITVAGPTVTARSGTATASTTCIFYDGKITVNGALATEEYSIDNGDSWVANTPAPQFTNLSPGTYTIKTKNINNQCVSNASANIVVSTPTVTVRQGTATATTNCDTPNGKITITGAVATEIYSIDNGNNWVESSPAPQFTDLPAGTYKIITKVLATDCVSNPSSNIVVGSPAVTVRQGTATATTSCAVPNGKITVTAAVATEKYSIDNGTTWVANMPTPQFTDLAGGTYQIKTKSIATGCISSASSNIVVNSPAVTVRSGTVTAPTSCSPYNGKITVTGAVATEEYSIDNGDSWVASTPAPQFTDLTNGTYRILTRVIATECISAASAVLTVVAPVVTSRTGTATVATSCINPNGSISVTGAVATELYSIDNGITWVSSATPPQFRRLLAGTYQILTKDVAKNCVSVLSPNIVVTGPIPPTAPVVSVSGSTTFCQNRTVTLTASSATNYLWSTGATTQAITVSAAGDYSVKAINSAGCQSNSSQATSITVNPLPTAAITSSATSFCAGSNLTLTANTGTGLTYQWYNGTTAISGSTSSTYSANAAGTYSVIVSNSSTCSATSNSITLTTIALPTATIDGTGSICSGATRVIAFNGTANAVVTYKINNGPNKTVTLNASGTASVTSDALTATTTYALVSVAANGCSATLSGSAVITINSLPSAAITSSTTSFCAGSNLTLTANTGTGLTYQWYNGTTAISGSTSSTYSANAAGTYSVIVSNSSTCSATSNSITLTTIALPTATIDGTGSICSGATRVIAFNGTANAVVTYKINNDPNKTVTLNASGTASVTSDALTTTTTYALVSVAANGCSATLSGSAVITINSLPAAAITSSTTSFCAGSNLTLTANTGTGLTYQWYNGTTAISGSTSSTYSANAAGTYSVIVSNSSTCSATSNSITLTTIALPTATIDGTGSICAGATRVVAFNGTANAVVTYKINNGPNKTVTLNASGTASVTSDALTATTTYALVSVAANGCSATLSGSAVITINPLPSAAITSSTTSFCAGSNLTLTANTGTGLTYQWYNGTTAISGSTSSTYSANAAGNYSVIVSNSSTCSATSNSITLTTIALPTATIDGTGSICSGATRVIAFNGTANAVVTYKINNGSNKTITLNASGTASVTSDALTATTTYALVSVAANGCSATLSGSAIITINSLPTAAITSSATSFCAGSNLTLTANTGTGLTYQWYNGTTAISGSTSSTYSANAAGTYSVIVSNSSTCSATSNSITLTTIALPTATIDGTGSICAGATRVVAFNGTANAVVTYKINNGPNKTVTLNASGTASVTSDALTATTTYALVSVAANGCSATLSGSAIITINSLPSAAITSSTTSFCAGSNLTLTANTGTGLTYQWYNGTTAISGSTSSTYSANAAGTYSVIVSNSSTCSATSNSITLTTIALPTATIDGTGSICSGATRVIAFNGTANAVVTYKINNGSNKTITLNASGTASVTSDALTATTTYALVSVAANGCSATLSGSAIITINSLPSAAITSSTTSFCAGSNLTLTANTGTGLTYQWYNGTTAISGSTSSTYSANAAGTYSVIVSNSSTCSATSNSITLTTISLPTATIDGTGSICAGATRVVAFNGTANAVVTYTINNGPNKTVTLNASGTASVTSDALTTTTTYALVSVAANGCSATLSGSAVITVYSVPTATITSNSPICSGSQATVTISGTPNAIATYQVNAGGIQTVNLDATGKYAITTPALTTATSYTLLSVASNSTPSCPQTPNMVTNIAINPLPTADISGTISICPGSSAPIVFTGSPNARVSYTVNGGTTSLIDLNASGTASITAGPLNTTSVYRLTNVAYTGANTCGQSLNKTATVTVETVLTAVVTGPTEITRGTAATLTITGTPGGIVTYKVNDVLVPTITIGANGQVSFSTGILMATTVYAFVSVALPGTVSCSQPLSHRVSVTVQAVSLAIQLTSFKAKRENEKVVVKWETATETNNDHFVVEHSTNGADFAPIAQVQGAGNSFTPNNYQVEDQGAIIGVNYYRLIQVDYDSKSTTSEIISVYITNKGNAIISRYNTLGQKINDIESGMMIEVEDEDEEEKKRKIVK